MFVKSNHKNSKDLFSDRILTNLNDPFYTELSFYTFPNFHVCHHKNIKKIIHKGHYYAL